MTPDQIESFQKNPRFIGMKFPEMNKPETLEKRYLGKLSKKALMFMKECLKMDPAQRITASKALQHPYFDGIRDAADAMTQHQEVRIESANLANLVISSNPSETISATNLKTLSKTNLNATLNSQSNLNGQKTVQQISIAHTRHEGAYADQ